MADLPLHCAGCGTPRTKEQVACPTCEIQSAPIPMGLQEARMHRRRFDASEERHRLWEKKRQERIDEIGYEAWAKETDEAVRILFEPGEINEGSRRA